MRSFILPVLLVAVLAFSACMRPDAGTAMPKDIETWKGQAEGSDNAGMNAAVTFILTRMPLGDGKDIEGVQQWAVSSSFGGAGQCRFDVTGRLDDGVLEATGRGACSLEKAPDLPARLEFRGTLSEMRAQGEWTLYPGDRTMKGTWKVRKVE